MITLEEKAYAKLNLTLDVGPKREDGYHEISTVMQPLTLCDDLTITLGTGEPWQVRGDVPEVPTGRKNLCYKAAKAFYNASGTDPNGITVEIVKRIPMGAGLGGGSADAAAVLRALNRHEGDRFTQAELEKLGLEVGSDVPFCLRNKIALAEGRGERFSEVPAMPPCYYVLVKPDFQVSTADLYWKLDNIRVPAHPKVERFCKAIELGDLREIGVNLLNVFEYALLGDHPELDKIENALENCGALGTSMTGTGPVMFGLFENFDFAATASMSLMQVGYQTFLATNLDLDAAAEPEPETES